MSKRDESKLPKWARDDLQRLRNNLSAAQERLNQVMGVTDEPSPIRVEDFDQPSLFMPERTILAYGEDHNHQGRSGLLVRWVRAEPSRGPFEGRAYVEVMAANGLLSVRPQAANVIRVYEEFRR